MTIAFTLGSCLCWSCLVFQPSEDLNIIEISKSGKYEIKRGQAVLVSVSYFSGDPIRDLELLVNEKKVNDQQIVLFPNRNDWKNINIEKKAILFRPKMPGKIVLKLRIYFGDRKQRLIGPFELNVKESP